MPVDFPARTRKTVIGGPAPSVDGLVGSREVAIGTEVRDRCDHAGGRRRADDAVLLDERSLQFDPTL